jgi:hypothetical protein
LKVLGEFIALAATSGGSGRLLIQPIWINPRFYPAMRRLFTILSTLSLLLCVATCVLWVRSAAMKTGDRFGWTKVAGEAGRRAEVSSVDGEIRYAHDTAATPFLSAGYADAPGAGWESGDPNYIAHRMDSQLFNDEGDRHEWEHAGISFVAWNHGCLDVSVKDWGLALVAGTLPAVWLMMRLRVSSRVKPGHCTACGYDLRATPGRCPECGRQG